jgi:hypothetical protein
MERTSIDLIERAGVIVKDSKASSQQGADLRKGERGGLRVAVQRPILAANGGVPVPRGQRLAAASR